MNNKQIRGFVTIATGKDKYYELAYNLLLSYRRMCKTLIPFAIICDRENQYTTAFDDVVVIEKPCCSYMDKLKLYEYSPYYETIFIDADCLILQDPNVLWNDFAQEDDFSCYGRKLSLSSKSGWFLYEEMGELKQRIQYGIQMHGGIYYFRKTEKCEVVFKQAIKLAEEYSKYKFSHFSKPADEPVLALSMALEGVVPCEKQGRVLFVPSMEGKIKVTLDGNVQVRGCASEGVVIHFATSNVERFIYRYLLQRINEPGNPPDKRFYWKLRLKCLPLDIKVPVVRKIKRTIKYALPQSWRERIISRK